MLPFCSINFSHVDRTVYLMHPQGLMCKVIMVKICNKNNAHVKCHGGFHLLSPVVHDGDFIYFHLSEFI